jgi:hypothetical protein
VPGQTPEERVAIVVWHLSHGDAFTSAEAGRMLGLTRQGADWLLCNISRVVPIYKDEDNRWQVMAMREANP